MTIVEFKTEVTNKLLTLITLFLEQRDHENYKIIYAWYDNEFNSLMSRLNGLLSEITDSGETIDLESMITIDTTDLTLSELQLLVYDTVINAERSVYHQLQKRGKKQINETISEAEFNRYQSLMGNILVIEDENGTIGIAQWNNTTSIKNGNRVQLLSDIEIKSYKAAVQ